MYINVSLAQQVTGLALAIGVGFSLGIAYDVLRIPRLLLFSGNVAVFFHDVLFWGVSGVVTYLFILAVNFGEIRAYLLFGEIIGGVIYYTLIGTYVSRAADKVASTLKKFFSHVFKLIFLPVKRIFVHITNFSKKHMKNALIFLNNCKISLKKQANVLYNTNINVLKSKRGKSKKSRYR